MKELAKPYLVRLYPKHRDIIKKQSKKLKIKPSAYIRLAIEVGQFSDMTLKDGKIVWE